MARRCSWSSKKIYTFRGYVRKDMTFFITKRTLQNFFEKASSQFPVMLVSGARQVGKTTFLQYLAAENRTCVTLDDGDRRNVRRHP